MLGNDERIVEGKGQWNVERQGIISNGLRHRFVQAQAEDAVVVMSQFPLLDCDHGQSDHGAIENAQTNYDKPLYFQMYGHPNWCPQRQLLDFWKKSEARWKMRFGDE